MRLLLDECLPKKLKLELSEHDVVTVQEQGWSGKKNGELLKLTSGVFEVFITVDQNLRFQQNLVNLSLRIVVLVAPNNRLLTLKPLMPQVREALTKIKIGEVILITD